METKKYFDLLGLLPIALITLCFLTEEDLHKKTKNLCIGNLLSLSIFIALYIMLLFLKIRKCIALSISIILWVLFVIVRKRLE